MKRLFKWALRLVLLIVVLLVLLLLFKDAILRVVMENRIRARTGMDVKIGRFSSSLLSPVMTIEDLRVYNTAEFGGTPFLTVPEIHLEFDSAALARRELHVSLARVRLAEVDVVRNAAGQTNLFSIFEKVRRRKKEHRDKWFGDLKVTGIDTLNVSLGKGRFVDLADNRNNCERVLDIRDQVFSNVKSRNEVTGMLILLYLRSGGNLCFLPQNSLEGYLTGIWPLSKPKPAPEAPAPPQPAGR